MSAQRPPRLWLRESKGRAPMWFILDGGKQIATGCAAADRTGAEKLLGQHIVAKHQPARERNMAPDAIPVPDVLMVYLEAVGGRVADPDELWRRVGALLDFWGMKTLADVTGASCRSYVAQSRSAASARRELEDLRSAINLHRKEGFHDRIVSVTLPAKAKARERWLTRSEAARLIWACWRFRQSRNGELTGRFPRRHIARFILAALYSGSRSGAVLDASFEKLPGRGFVDLERGVWYRSPEGAVETNKRRPTIQIPRRLLAHMKRWHANGARHVVEYEGQPIETTYFGFMLSAKDAGLDDVHPHVLRHTSVSWLVQSGADHFAIGRFVGMSAQTIQNVYGHLAPSHLARVGALLERGGR
jgi:integrase